MAQGLISRRRLIQSLPIWALGGAASTAADAAIASPPRQEPPALLLAREAPADVDPAGYLVSEKLDGVRALWDGEQLRFRSGAAVPAPASFLRQLPPQPLDGELWLGRGRFSELAGLVKRQGARDADWAGVRYQLFELPGVGGPFEARAQALAALAEQLNAPALWAVPQLRVAHREALQTRLRQVVAAGGEGLMLHRADAPYESGRSGVLLKLKPQQDAEAVVLEQRLGTEGRMRGLLVALRLGMPEGGEFLLGSGFSDALRRNPPPPGSVVTYRYRGWSAHGLPRFASFVRVDPGF
jgi:DNA ligase-1